VSQLAVILHISRSSGGPLFAVLCVAQPILSSVYRGLSVLDPSTETFSLNLQGLPDHPLTKEKQQVKKKADVSRGERQRLVAARTFMQFNSGKVKFVAVDEPSSALDAEGELRLFEKLLEVRDGKTMVFVTHRFGHLIRHADQILCIVHERRSDCRKRIPRNTFKSWKRV
ncbi:hypothetical protein BDQ12DRAFT_774870, partial [Crucibulum laeve]